MDNKYKKHMIYLNKMDKILFCFFFEKEETITTTTANDRGRENKKRKNIHIRFYRF